MLLFILYELGSIIDDSGSVVSSIVSSHPILLSFHMLAGNLDRARFDLRRPQHLVWSPTALWLNVVTHLRRHGENIWSGRRFIDIHKIYGVFGLLNNG